MVIAFQIILLIIILVSFGSMIGNEKDKKINENYMFICAIAIAIFFASEVWL